MDELRAQLIHHLKEIDFLLTELNDEQYADSPDVFFGASIGKHLRHVYEFLETISTSLESGVVNYDARRRDPVLETDRSYSRDKFNSIRSFYDNCNFAEKDLRLMYHLNGEEISARSSLSRELIFNIEHLVHHLALIRQGIVVAFPGIRLAADFGVAHSTLQYRRSESRS